MDSFSIVQHCQGTWGRRHSERGLFSGPDKMAISGTAGCRFMKSAGKAGNECLDCMRAYKGSSRRNSALSVPVATPIARAIEPHGRAWGAHSAGFARNPRLQAPGFRSPCHKPLPMMVCWSICAKRDAVPHGCETAGVDRRAGYCPRRRSPAPDEQSHGQRDHGGTEAEDLAQDGHGAEAAQCLAVRRQEGAIAARPPRPWWLPLSRSLSPDPGGPPC